MTAPTRSGIPTTYRGAAFRSRLEARWAAFFDLVGWHWTYEPLDAGHWIPDFLIHGEAAILVEVGPCAVAQDFIDKAAKPSRYDAHPTLVLGVSPDVLRTRHDPYAGVLVNEFRDNGAAPAFWTWCDACDKLTIYGDDIQHSCGHSFSHGHEYHEPLEHLWSRAGSVVQWQPA